MYCRYCFCILYVHRRPNGREGFVPVNYVKEVVPTVIRNNTKKKVVKPVKAKLRKKRTEQRKIPKRRSSSALSNYVHLKYNTIQVQRRKVCSMFHSVPHCALFSTESVLYFPLYALCVTMTKTLEWPQLPTLTNFSP